MYGVDVNIIFSQYLPPRLLRHVMRQDVKICYNFYRNKPVLRCDSIYPTFLISMHFTPYCTAGSRNSRYSVDFIFPNSSKNNLNISYFTTASPLPCSYNNDDYGYFRGQGILTIYFLINRYKARIYLSVALTKYLYPQD